MAVKRKRTQRTYKDRSRGDSLKKQTTELDDKTGQRKTEESKMYFGNHLAWEPENRRPPLTQTEM